ncbi:hypothetical protein CVT24_009276 [Panaeolus cyanescens]|uniref:Uncharacterized protein n=1 Tax=Panaeolus cyanescens TaxID=181874 RepID=A0A409WTP1_9AGAR|nr:hypothetical protein CVT24_009276 [Panaeolus cyanescens]
MLQSQNNNNNVQGMNIDSFRIPRDRMVPYGGPGPVIPRQSANPNGGGVGFPQTKPGRGANGAAMGGSANAAANASAAARSYFGYGSASASAMSNLYNSFQGSLNEEDMQASSHALASVFANMPWMTFSIVAKPDIGRFSQDENLRGIVAQITKLAVNCCWAKVARK